MVLLLLVNSALTLFIHQFVQQGLLSFMLAFMLTAPLVLYVLHRFFKPIQSLFRAIEGTVTSYRDRDFSFSLHWPHHDELRDLVSAHNALGHTLRDERKTLVQRELLLDTMVQNTPVAMALVTEQDIFIYGNISARHLLNRGNKLEGLSLNALLQQSTAAFQEAFKRTGDSIFTVGEQDSEEVYLLSRRKFQLNSRQHTLILIRQLTAELRRQEVQTWKKVIRIISHELNNSLAPIASLAHSGNELRKREQYQRLEAIFLTIAERARHLEQFIKGYAQFAKIPNPKLEAIEWPKFFAQLQQQISFSVIGDVPAQLAHIDPAQMTQAMLNVLKNAHESSSPIEDIQLSIQRLNDRWRIDITDRGHGMSEAVLANAFVPFYSTKRNGSGLGLALVREIVEAHGGKLSFGNRHQGGLRVTISLPIG